MNQALYNPDFPTNLFALGQLQRFGGNYSTVENKEVLISDSTGRPLDKPRLTETNLLPINFNRLLQAYKADPSKYMMPSPPGLPRKPSYHASLSTDNANNNTDQLTQTAIPTAPTSQLAHRPPSTHTREQISRALAAQDLHCSRLHPSDKRLATDLQTGKIPYSRLTPADLTLYRTLYGPCLDCIQGKATAPPRPTSQSAPADKTGQVLSYDPQPLTTQVLGGHTIKNILVDEHSKHINIFGSLNKRPPIVFAALMKQIRETYNANRHRVETLMADPEAINKALQASLGTVGIAAKYALPGEHATRAERDTRTVQGRGRAVVASLPYILPPETQLLLDQAVCESWNNSVHPDTHPLTPNQVVSNFLPTKPIVEFGRSAMVLQHDDKRRDISSTHNVPLKQVAKAEIGVSMGPVPGTDTTRFLLENGKVVPRKVISLLPRSYVPFNWKPKPRLQAYHHLPPDQPTQPQQQRENSTTTTTTTTAPPSPPPEETYNVNVQNPDADNTIAQSIPQTPTEQPFTPLANTPSSGAAAPDVATSQPPSPPSPAASPLNTQLVPSVVLVTPLRAAAPAQVAPPAALPATPQRAAPAPPPTPPRSAALTLPNIPRAVASAPAPPAPTRTSNRTTHIPGKYASLNSRGRLGAYLNACAFVSESHLRRKLAASRTASQRERDHMRLFPPPKDLTNHLTNTLPTPPARQQNEFGLIKALTVLSPPKVIAAVDKELHKIFIKYGAMKLIQMANIEKHAVYLKSLLIIREKTNKDVTARLAINGAGQPPSSYGATHAGTSDPAHRIFILATALADAAIRNKKLVTASFDIEGAFINNNPLPRSATGGHQLLVRLPKELPRPYGGALAEITGSMYGLKQSNHIYDQNLIKTLADAGYFPCPSHPYTFMKICPENPQDYLIVSFHVDDGDLVCTSNHLLPEFKDIIIKRYGVTKFNEPSQGICGMRQTTNPDNSVTLDFGPYIEKMLHRIGMDKVPPALSPSRTGLFTLPTSITDLKPLSPETAANFSRINGELIFILPLRHDCRKEIVHLCRSLPIVDNFNKQFHLLRYLKHTANLGLTFSANKADFPNGVEISSASDAAQNVHPADSRSHSAYTLTVGPPHAKTAPFLAYSKAETSCIPLSPLESEYVAMSRSAKPLMHFRDFHTDLGFAPTSPSKMLADNQSAIKLVQAPLVPSKSRHIRLPFHHIRDLHKTGQIQPVHQGGTDIVPDILTKDTGPSRFLFFRDKLLGIR